MASSGDTAKRAPSRRRAVAFRLAAVLFALAPFALAELLFVILDWGRPTQHDDPFVGFSAVHPLFIRSDDGARCEIAPSRYRCFRPQSFEADKPADEYRIFCLGGSTVQGRPYAVETSLTTWLELNLQLAEPTRKWRVVNCGGISYASYRLVPILREVLGYEPDMIILYTGHNEFLEDREYAHIRDRPRWVAAPLELVTQTRTYNLLQDGYLRVTGTSPHADRPQRSVLEADVDAILDYQGGLEKYHRDEQWRQGVIEHFRYNVRRMVQMAQDARVPMLLINPPCNLRDCPPFKSQHRDGLSAEQLRRWRALRREAAGQSRSDPARAVELLREALAIDDQHADLHYRLAKELDALRDTRRALEAYVRAKELDICPLRILEPMSEAIVRIAGQTNAAMVDVRKLIEQRSPYGIPGDAYLSDHVHPRIAGHRFIADALIDELARQGVVHPRPGWRQQQEKTAMKHLASLGGEYFAEGLRRLESLRGWAEGRATLPPPEPDPNKP
ncbi:MAG: SGNH/GDSL hydrolase family protein [Phycisphaerae bacterium]